MDDVLDLGAALLIARIAVVREGPERAAYCRDCGRELGRWRAGESAPRLRCGACRPRPER